MEKGNGSYIVRTNNAKLTHTFVLSDKTRNTLVDREQEQRLENSFTLQYS